MQQVEPGPDLWWRADNPPTPRPVLQGSTGGSQQRRRPGLWVLGAAAFLLLGNPELRTAALGQIEQGAELAGLGLQQVALSGHRYAADSDIYDALDLDHIRTLMSCDSRAAKARVERLPWIERASIECVLPGNIDVRVVERVPFALWSLGDRHWLVDRAGRRLQAVPADVMPQLPRVAGEGAAEQAPAIAALLADYPSVARQVEVAERVGGRRWTLHLAGGVSVDLPSVGEAAALVRLTRLLELGLAGARHVDLRAPARVLVGGFDRAGTAANGAAVPSGRT